MSEPFFHVNEAVENYIHAFSDTEDSVLYELYRETHKKVLHPRMLSGPIQGSILKMFTHMIQPRRVLEIGTYTGYSSICIARGLSENGKLDTIEVNDELEHFILSFFHKAKVADKIHLHLGDAQSIIPNINERFDLVFIDGDKREYPQYLTLSKKHLRTGGFIIADNVLWNGKVVEKEDQQDNHTKGIHTFNKMVREESQLEKVIFPLRDGLMVIRKK